MRLLTYALLTVAGIFSAGPAAAAEAAAGEPAIRRIYIIHFSHTDIGFTDMPGVCRELQSRYLDIALDARPGDDVQAGGAEGSTGRASRWSQWTTGGRRPRRRGGRSS